MQINYLRQVDINPFFKNKKYIIYDNFLLAKGKENILLVSEKKKDTNLFRKDNLYFKNSCLIANKNLNDIVESVDYSYLVKKSMLSDIFKKFFKLKILSLRARRLKRLRSFNGLRGLVRVRFEDKYKDGFVVFLLGKSFFSSLWLLSLVKKKLPFKVFMRYLKIKKLFSVLFLFLESANKLFLDINLIRGSFFLKKSLFILNFFLTFLIKKLVKYVKYWAYRSFKKHKFSVHQRYLLFFKALCSKVTKYYTSLSVLINFSLFNYFICNLNKITKIKLFFFKYFLRRIYFYDKFFGLSLVFLNRCFLYLKSSKFLLKSFYSLVPNFVNSIWLEKFFLLSIREPFLDRLSIKISKNVYNKSSKFLTLENKLKKKKNISFHYVWKIRRYNRPLLRKLKRRILKLGLYKYNNKVLKFKFLTKLVKKYITLSYNNYRRSIYGNRNRTRQYFGYKHSYNNRRNNNYYRNDSSKRNYYRRHYSNRNIYFKQKF